MVSFCYLVFSRCIHLHSRIPVCSKSGENANLAKQQKNIERIQMLRQVLLTFALLCVLAVLRGAGSECSEYEFQCYHPDDGCIRLEDVCSGWVDCMRDGSDESEEECVPGKRVPPPGRNVLTKTSVFL